MLSTIKCIILEHVFLIISSALYSDNESQAKQTDCQVNSLWRSVRLYTVAREAADENRGTAGKPTPAGNWHIPQSFVV